jgi:lipoprotein-anchoring transpeptidase ErfK/SrfK
MWRRVVPAALVVVLGAGLAACQTSSSATEPTPPPAPPSSSAPVPAATLAVQPADGATDVAIDQQVSVRADGGKLADVNVEDVDGNRVPGAAATPDGAWVSAGGLIPSTTYKISATAVNAAGEPTTLTSTFTTAAPAKVLGSKVAPLENETVGVGMPIVVYFTAPVTDRAAVEKRLRVEESMPVLGAWHWYSDTEVHYRPAQYWPPGEKVTLTVGIKGVNAGNGVWGVNDRIVHFQVGDSHIATVDAKTDKMTVEDNGKVVKEIPVSLGRDKYPTTSGIHVVLEKTPSIVMDSATVGIPKGNPDYYKETVLWDVRISWSGEFVHAAPWSVADQGRENVSHGCVNASTADAQWFYDFSRRGDIVQVFNTPRKLESQNGWTDWNMPWQQWLAGSAIDSGAADGGASGSPPPGTPASPSSGASA